MFIFKNSNATFSVIFEHSVGNYHFLAYLLLSFFLSSVIEFIIGQGDNGQDQVDQVPGSQQDIE